MKRIPWYVWVLGALVVAFLLFRDKLMEIVATVQTVVRNRMNIDKAGALTGKAAGIADLALDKLKAMISDGAGTTADDANDTARL